MPSTEAIEDMRVQVKTYDAEMGRAAGGVFNVTAKSGSNLWHGSALFMNKPGWGDRSAVLRQAGRHAEPAAVLLLWAGSLGGPIVKDRTFFWFSKDDYLQKSTRNNVLTFPTARERAGDFSQTCAPADPIYDPLTTRPNPNGTGFIRDPFPGNVIPADRINPIARAMLDADADAGLGPFVQRSGDSRRRSAGSGDAEGRSSLGREVDDHRHVWSPAHGEPGSAFWGPFGTIPADPAQHDRLPHDSLLLELTR